MSDFGSGLGGIIGGSLASNDLSDASMTIRGMGGDFNATTAPYNTFGQSFLPGIQGEIANAQNLQQNTVGYTDFMKNYQTSPAAEYAMGQATEAQNNSAASTGQLLSGTNQRALSTINQGIASQFANNAYDEYLKGNSQQFGQLQGILGSMFQGVGVGTTATGQQAGVLGSQIGAQSQIAQAQAKADQGKGSGIGSLFSGIGSMFTGF